MLDSQIEEIKNRLDIVEVISSYIKLQKAGSNFKALCPFHSEKTPSFMVSPSRQIWHCFGCGAGGNIFSFIMKIENVEFPEALKILADKAGVVLRREDPKLRSEKIRIFNLMEAATKFYETNLEKTPAGQKAKKYLLERGLKEETIKDFRLGFALDSWDALLRFLLSRGYKNEEIDKAGLVIKNLEKNTDRQYYDRFRSRIIFPIFNLTGQVVGFSGRIFGKNEEEAKYINTPNTILYDKSRILYGLDKAKNEIKKKDYCFLVEGQMDLLMTWQEGIKNVCATSGTALTSYHLNILKRYSENLILGFDMDEAGEMATQRGIDLARSYGLNISIISLPESKDPADFIKENPQKMETILKSAKPIMEYYFERVFNKYQPVDLEQKKKIASLLLFQIKKIYNKIEQAYWLEKLAQKLAVPPDFLLSELKKIKPELSYQSLSCIELPNEKKSREEMLAEYLMALILHSPQYRVYLSSLEANLPSYFAVLANDLKNFLEPFSFERFYQNLPLELQEKVDRLILRADYELERNSQINFSQEIKKVIDDLNLQKIKNDLKFYEEEIKKAQEKNDYDLILALTKNIQNLLEKRKIYEKKEKKENC